MSTPGAVSDFRPYIALLKEVEARETPLIHLPHVRSFLKVRIFHSTLVSDHAIAKAVYPVAWELEAQYHATITIATSVRASRGFRVNLAILPQVGPRGSRAQ
jgi:hypothetical protein